MRNGKLLNTLYIFFKRLKLQHIIKRGKNTLKKRTQLTAELTFILPLDKLVFSGNTETREESVARLLLPSSARAASAAILSPPLTETAALLLHNDETANHKIYQYLL